MHFVQNVGSADQLAVKVELRVGRPVRVDLDLLSDGLVLQDIDRMVVLDL